MMNKRGIGVITLVVLGVVIGIVVIFGADMYLTSDPGDGDLPPSESEADAVDDGSPVGQPEQQTETSDSEASDEGFVDLVAYNLTLINQGCPDVNFTTGCSVAITGIVKNNGTVATSLPFSIHLYDATSTSYGLIKSYVYTGALGPGQVYPVSAIYDELDRDFYFIQLKVDPLRVINDTDFSNNRLNGLVEVVGPP